MLAYASPAAPEGLLPRAKGPTGPIWAPGGPKGATKGPKRGSRALNGPQTGTSGFGDFWIIKTFQTGADEGPKALGPRRGLGAFGASFQGPSGPETAPGAPGPGGRLSGL